MNNLEIKLIDIKNYPDKAKYIATFEYTDGLNKKYYTTKNTLNKISDKIIIGNYVYKFGIKFFILKDDKKSDPFANPYVPRNKGAVMWQKNTMKTTKIAIGDTYTLSNEPMEFDIDEPITQKLNILYNKEVLDFNI